MDLRLDTVIRDLAETVNRAFGKGTIMQLGTTRSEDRIGVIRSGSLALDAAIGIGGWPRGRIVEVYGPEASGKTTLTLHAIAEVQKAGGVAMFIDMEHVFDVAYARAIGVDIGHLLVSQPDTAEQALEIAEMAARSEVVDIVVIDCVTALVPKATIEGEMGEEQIGIQALLMSQALRKLTALAHRTDITIMCTSRTRLSAAGSYVSEGSAAGSALKFYASVRVELKRGRQNQIQAKVVKNKLAPPFAEANFDVLPGYGIDWAGDARLRCLPQRGDAERATLLVR